MCKDIINFDCIDDKEIKNVTEIFLILNMMIYAY